jgi:hypothetical protein
MKTTVRTAEGIYYVTDIDPAEWVSDGRRGFSILNFIRPEITFAPPSYATTDQCCTHITAPAITIPAFSA